MRMLLSAAVLVVLVTGAAAETVPTRGEVTKIDEAQGKITLKHEAIKNLDMDGMTMVFAAGDPAMLKAIKPGEKVIFEADRVNGRLTVVKIQKVK